jgi:hypothetical protein
MVIYIHIKKTRGASQCNPGGVESQYSSLAQGERTTCSALKFKPRLCDCKPRDCRPWCWRWHILARRKNKTLPLSTAHGSFRQSCIVAPHYKNPLPFSLPSNSEIAKMSARTLSFLHSRVPWKVTRPCRTSRTRCWDSNPVNETVQ